MYLYVRQRPFQSITFLSDKTLLSFIDNYDSLVDKPSFVLGDLATFSKSSLQRLLVFIEANPQIDCFSTQDNFSNIFLSRFIKVIKAPLPKCELVTLPDFPTYKDFVASQTFTMQALFPML